VFAGRVAHNRFVAICNLERARHTEHLEYIRTLVLRPRRVSLTSPRPPGWKKAPWRKPRGRRRG